MPTQHDYDALKAELEALRAETAPRPATSAPDQTYPEIVPAELPSREEWQPSPGPASNAPDQAYPAIVEAPAVVEPVPSTGLAVYVDPARRDFKQALVQSLIDAGVMDRP